MIHHELCLCSDVEQYCAEILLILINEDLAASYFVSNKCLVSSCPLGPGRAGSGICGIYPVHHLGVSLTSWLLGDKDIEHPKAP